MAVTVIVEITSNFILDQSLKNGEIIMNK